MKLNKEQFEFAANCILSGVCSLVSVCDENTRDYETGVIQGANAALSILFVQNFDHLDESTGWEVAAQLAENFRDMNYTNWKSFSAAECAENFTEFCFNFSEQNP